MSKADPSYEELRARLANAEMLLTALRRGEVDAVLSQSSVLLLSVQQAEAALRESEARYRALFEHSVDAVLLIGTDGDIIMANPAASRLFGYSAEELLRLREEALIDQTDRRTVYALTARAKAGQFQGEMKYSRRDKSPFIGETSSAVFEDGEKRTTVIIRDITDRIRAQQRLRVSEEKFRRYFELGLIGMAMTSRTKGILEVNDELCRILGYARKELLEKSWAEITHPDDLAADVAQFNRVIAGEIDGYTLDKRFIRKDGQVIDTIMSAKCLREADGLVDYLVELVQDISARKRVEQALQENQQRFQVALESSAVAFTILRAVRNHSARIVDFEWLYLNPPACRIIGRAPEDLINRRVREVLPGAWGPPGLFECFARVVETGEPQDIEVLSRRNGTDNWFHNIVAKLDDGVVVWFPEITERRQAEERLRRSEAFLAEGQKISQAGTWAVQFPAGEVSWSEEVYRIYGVDRDATKLSQQVAFELIHPEDRTYVKETFEGAVRAMSDFAFEHRAIMADGSIKHLHALGRPVLNDSGELIEYIGTVMDITARKGTEEELRKIQQELARVTRMTTMGEVAASIAHEINQPLGAIVNNSNVALRLADAPGGSRDALLETLSDVVNDATRASAIIARIRALATKTIPERISLQLRDVVNQALAFAQLELVEHRIVVHSELSDDLPTISGDRVQIQQVFLNLIMNGIEAMSEVEDARRILTISGELSRLNASAAVLITVHDLGVGFKREAREHLFEPFYTTKPDSLGMGLRISRSIAEAHGGRLWAQASETMGATFFLCLPAESSESCE